MKMVLFQLLAENEVRWIRMLMAEKYVNEVGQKRKLRSDQANDYCSHVRQ